MEKTLIIKFGGAAVAHAGAFSEIAKIILKRAQEYPRIVVVVSAMQGVTDQLIELAKQVHPAPPQREYDMLLTVGERTSMSLLAMALARQNGKAASLTGSQAGIITSQQHTEAKIIEVRPQRILSLLDKNHTVIVAGFQGVSRQGEITTLGRGGSDTTAVALGLAVGAERVEFYKDVAGIYSQDPKIDLKASLYKTLTYSQALDIAEKGIKAKVLHPRAVALAQKNKMPLLVRSFQNELNDCEGTYIAEEGSAKEALPLYEEEEISYGISPSCPAVRQENQLAASRTF